MSDGLPRSPEWHCVPCAVLWSGSNRCWVCGQGGRRRGIVETMKETLAVRSSA